MLKKILALLFIITVSASCQEKSYTAQITTVKPEAASSKVSFVVENGFFCKIENGVKEKFLIKGVNLGTGIPGAFPDDKKADKETYLRWFGLMKEMNVNAVRVYTLQNAAFYNALYEYNNDNDDPLYFFQGFYNSESLYLELQNAFAEPIIKEVETEIPIIVDTVHGNRKSTESINGEFITSVSVETLPDVSPWLIGYILGIETDEEFVENTNAANPDKNSFTGEYFYTADDASPYEAYLTFMLETCVFYEEENYGEQHPVAFTNWVTTDPLTHPNEPDPNEDGTSVDADNIIPTASYEAGMFASYHIYPYYPESIFYDEEYRDYVNKYGETDPYMAYLLDLEAYHKIPVLVSEFGMTTSRGMNHLNWVTEYNQGYLTEREQGEMDAHLFRDIADAGMAGGMVFTWQDEWFKRSWNTMDFNTESGRPYWSNIEASEQMYGLLTFDPGFGKTLHQTDGDISEWEETPLIANDGIEVKVQTDERYMYFLIDDTNMKADDNYIIGIDTIKEQGNNFYADKDIEFQNYNDFAIVISEADNQIYVDSYYDTYIPYYIKTNVLADRLHEDNESGINTGVFNPIRLCTSQELLFPSSLEHFPSQIFVTGELREGNSNPESEDFDSLADFYRSEKTIEIRIPWALLNFSDPSTSRIIDDFNKRDSFELVSIVIEEVGIELVKQSKGETFQAAGVYKLNPWGEFPGFNERLKESYYIMQEAYAKIG